VKALDVIDAYFAAHHHRLPDGRIHGLSDAEAIIRRRYLHGENPREALLSLRPDEFEFLIGALYEEIGYEVVVTQTSRDGGVDVEARRSDVGGQALILIQCKRYADVVRVPAVRELMGVVSRRQANKGVIVATCGFTQPARQEATSTPMIELIDFPLLNRLLNQYMGAKWPERITHEIRHMKLASMKSQAKGNV
jgi:restriction system protein